MLDADHSDVRALDPPDADLVYANYLRTCATLKSGLSSAAAAHVRLKGACLRAS